MREYTIGVDVGGTKTRVGLVDSNLRLINHQRDQAERLCFISCGMSTIGTKENGLITFATPTLKRYPDLPITTLQQMLVVYITQAVNELQKDVPSAIVRAGAMSFAGIVKENAVVTKAADLYFRWGTWGEVDTLLAKQPGKEFCLKKQLEKNMPSITWFIINDVVAAANRYCQLPRYQHLQTLGLLTISTGVGYILFNRSAGTLGDGDLVSLGHRIVDTSSEAAACDCGGKGHLAAYFSGKAVENKVRAGAVRICMVLFIHLFVSSCKLDLQVCRWKRNKSDSILLKWLRGCRDTLLSRRETSAHLCIKRIYRPVRYTRRATAHYCWP